MAGEFDPGEESVIAAAAIGLTGFNLQDGGAPRVPRGPARDGARGGRRHFMAERQAQHANAR
jgi:hypothetical protein